MFVWTQLPRQAPVLSARCQLCQLKCSRIPSPPLASWLATTSSAVNASIPGCKGETFPTHIVTSLGEWKLILVSFLSF